MMFCTQCGSFVADGENYCRNCGNYVGDVNQKATDNGNYNIDRKIDIDDDFNISESTDIEHNISFNVGQAINEEIQSNTNVNIQPQIDANVQSNVNTSIQSNVNANINNGYNMNQNNSYNPAYKAPVRRTNTAAFVCMGVGIGVFLLFVVGGIFLTLVGGYYFSDSAYADGIIETVTRGGGKYKTVIKTDNTYSDVSINSVEEANNLIVTDSVKQKGTTSEEIKTIENQIIDNYGITAVNLCEMDPGFSREIGNVIKKITDEYPSTKGYMTNLSLNNASIREQYIAAFLCLFHFAESNTDSGMPWVMKTQIFLNASYYLNIARLEATVKDGSNEGHFPPNATIYSPVAHEFGHYLSFIAVLKKYGMDSVLLIDEYSTEQLYEVSEDYAEGDYSLEMIKEAHQKYCQDTNTNIPIDEWRAKISDYAVAKDNNGDYIYDETIAEAFHDVYLNGDNANDVSKYVVSVLKSKLEG